MNHDAGNVITKDRNYCIVKKVLGTGRKTSIKHRCVALRSSSSIERSFY